MDGRTNCIDRITALIGRAAADETRPSTNQTRNEGDAHEKQDTRAPHTQGLRWTGCNTLQNNQTNRRRKEAKKRERKKEREKNEKEKKKKNKTPSGTDQ
jgi:hypothetical protein